MSATPAQIDVHDMARQLTSTYSHAEPYTQHRGTATGTETVVTRHVTKVPSLVHQLLSASPAGSGEEAGSGGGRSRPAARVEAVDTLMLIDDEAARWLRRLGEDDPGDELEVVRRTPATPGPACEHCDHPSCRTVRLGEHVQRRPIPGSGTIACIRRVYALRVSAKPCGGRPHRDDGGAWCCTHHHIEYDLERWWRQARIISGWDSPAWRPDNTCPVCDQRRSLRVSLAVHSAFCVECRTTWGASDIGLLAEHIRGENADGVPDGLASA